jgi:competence protein ComEC
MPLLWLSLAFLGGVLLGDYLGWSLTAWLLLAALWLSILVVRPVLSRVPFLQRIHLPARVSEPAARLCSLIRAPVPYPFLLLIFSLGGARFALSEPRLDERFIAWYNDLGVEYVVEGVIVDPPDARDYYTNLRVRAEEIHPLNNSIDIPVDGLLLAKVTPGDDWWYGDRVRLQGEPGAPPEGEAFSYRDYLARQGIYSFLSYPDAQLVERGQGSPVLASIYELRRRALEVVYQIYPDPEASLLAGILLGDESGIPEHVDQAFKDTGTSHIIVISGFNITVIAGLLATVSARLIGRGRVGARWSALIALVGIILYTILVGGDAAVVRAAIMGGLTLFAMQLGRRQDGLNSLAFVAALMVLANPNVLWEVSFQLSFAATLGLILYAGPFSSVFADTASRWVPPETVRRFSGPVGEYLLFTVAASLMTLPIILYHFQRLSLISFIANPLILPVQPPVMILGGLAVILGMVYPPLGQLAAYLAWPFVLYTIRMVEFLARAPHAAITLGRVSLLAVAVFYGCLLGWTFAGERIRNWFADRDWELPSKVWFAAAALLGVLVVLVWQVALSAPDGRLHMTVLDVGSGEAVLVQSPTGRALLVNGGASPSRLSDSLGRRLPLTGRALDWLVVAAASDTQLAALPDTIDRFPPEQVLWSGPAAGSRSASFLRQALSEASIPITRTRQGHSLDLGGGAVLQVLANTPRGCILLLEWGNFQALLPIGLDFAGMQSLTADRTLTSVTSLLLADGGYAPLNTPEWLARWDPRIVLLSVEAGDKDGLPDWETLAAVEGRTLLRTDQHGWIRLSTDGQQLWVEVERKP